MTMAIEVCSVAVIDVVELDAVAGEVLAQTRSPSGSSAIRASSRAGTPSRDSPTATLAGLPPGANSK